MIGKLYDHYEQLISFCKAVHIIVELPEFLGGSAVLHRCGLLLQRERHGVSVFHDREPCKNDWTDRDAVEPIEMPFGIWTQVDPMNHVLSRGSMLK